MRPTVFRYKDYRFFFFSREEMRKHVHIYCPDGEAKFWIDPHIELVKNYGLSASRLNEIEKIIKDRVDEITDSWNKHFRD
jgi:hypothetical protein